MFRRLLAAATALVAAAALSFVASPALADPPADQSNTPIYWQTPGTGEICASTGAPGGTTWSLPAPPANSVWTKVVIKAGSGASVDAENNAYVDNLTYKYPADAPGTTWNVVGNLASTTFSHPSGKEISHIIYCWAPIPPTQVSGSASATAETCEAGDLVGGVITVVITTGVVYTITGPSGAVAFDAATGMTASLPPGDYTVGVAAAPGNYVLSGPSSIPLTIAPYVGECDDDPTEVSGSASATAQTCVADALVGGVITVVVTEGVTYTITGPSGAVAFDAVTGMTAPLPPGDYTVAVSASGPDYVLTGASSIPLTIGEYEGPCGKIEVTPSATVTDQTCVGEVMLVGGMITVGVVEGITYTITGPDGAVAFDAVTGETGELPPGDYTVTPAAQDGYVLTSDDDLIRTVGAYEGECDPPTLPIVEPAATSKAITCEAPGTITLSSDLVEEEFELLRTFSVQALEPVQVLATGGVIWTINGVETPEGTFTVPGPGVYHVHAEANGPEYGFAEGTRTDWTFTFTDPGTCELTTLALTGADGSAAVAALAAGLGLLGAALIRTGGRRARRVA